MVDVNTIIGDPIMTGNDTVIVPVSRVSLGFLCGGGEYGAKCKKNETPQSEENRHPFIGASAAGLSLTPMAFLTVTNGCVRVLPANYNCTVDRIIELVPESIRQIERVVKDACEKKKEAGENLHRESVSSPEE